MNGTNCMPNNVAKQRYNQSKLKWTYNYISGIIERTVDETLQLRQDSFSQNNESKYDFYLMN